MFDCHGGDQWFAPSQSDAVLDLIASKHLRTRGNMAHIDADAGTRSAINVLLRSVLIPRLPSWERRRRTVARTLGVSTTRTEARLDERPSPDSPPQFRRPAAQQYSSSVPGLRRMSIEVFDRTAARAGVEYRHPYLIGASSVRVSNSRRRASHAYTGPSAPARGITRAAASSIAARTSKASFGKFGCVRSTGTCLRRSGAASEFVQAGWVDLARRRQPLRGRGR